MKLSNSLRICSLALALSAAMPIFAQEFQSKDSVPKMLAVAESKGLDHAKGILFLLLGQAAKGEEVFDKIIATKGLKSDLSGLEEAATGGTEVGRLLRAQRTSMAISSGPASAHNNRGIARLMLGRFEEAIEDFDKAAVLDPDSGLPWINAAISQLELGRIELSEKSAKSALLLREKGARIQTVLGEIDFRAGRIAPAEERVKQALNEDSSYPFANLLKAKIDQRQGRSRDAERAFVQALAGGPSLITGARYKGNSGEAQLIGGQAGESHLKVNQTGFSSNGAYSLSLQDDRLRIEDRGGAAQRLSFFEGAYSGGIGSVYAIHRDSAGGRPGATTSFAGLPISNNASFSLKDSQVFWIYPARLGPNDNLTLHATGRQFSVNVKPNLISPSTEVLRDHQWESEFRLDHFGGKRHETNFGAAYSQVDRMRNGATPIEPLEQVLPAGKVTVWTGYLLHRYTMTENLELTTGFVAASAAGDRQGQPVLQLGLKTGSGRSVALRLTPRVNDSVSNLIPLDIVGGLPKNNQIDRTDFISCIFNNQSVVEGTKSKIVNFELVFGDDSRPGISTSATIFARRLSDFNIQGADPRVSSSLQLTPIQAGSATGLEGRITNRLGGGLSVGLVARLQDTKADFPNQTYEGKDYPILNPITERQIPNFPKFQATARLDLSVGKTQAGFELSYASKRRSPITTATGSGPGTFLIDSKAATGLHFYYVQRLGGRSELVFTLFNLTRSTFYPGYPGNPTGILMFNSRF